MPPTSPHDGATVDQATQAELSLLPFDKIVAGNIFDNAQIEALVRKLREVAQKNVGLQVLHEQQAKCIAELKIRINELQLQREPAAAAAAVHELPSQLPPSSSCGPSATGLWSCGTGGACVTNSATSWQEDACELKNECSRLKSENEKLEETIRCLQAHLQSAESSIEHLKSTVDELREAVDEKQTKIDVLQAQAIVYREDFNKERLDRQRAHCRLAELETDVDNYMKTMGVLTPPTINRTSAPAIGCHHGGGATPTGFSQVAVRRHNGDVTSNMSSTARSIQSRSGTRRRHHDRYQQLAHLGFDDVDCDSSAAAQRASSVTRNGAKNDPSSLSTNLEGWKATSSGANVTTGESRMFPTCRQRFTSSQHLDLMGYVEACS